jgi:hypothetical protein
MMFSLVMMINNINTRIIYIVPPYIHSRNLSEQICFSHVKINFNKVAYGLSKQNVRSQSKLATG